MERKLGYIVFDGITLGEVISFGEQIKETASIIIKPNGDGEYVFKAYGDVPTDWEAEDVNCGLFQGKDDFELLKLQYGLLVK